MKEKGTVIFSRIRFQWYVSLHVQNKRTLTPQRYQSWLCSCGQALVHTQKKKKKKLIQILLCLKNTSQTPQPEWPTQCQFSKYEFQHKFTDLWANTSILNKKNLIPQSIAISLSIIQTDFWQQQEAGSSHPPAAPLKLRHMFYEEARW